MLVDLPGQAESRTRQTVLYVASKILRSVIMSSAALRGLLPVGIASHEMRAQRRRGKQEPRVNAKRQRVPADASGYV